MQHQSPKFKGGFTLIEITIVVVILGVLIVMVVPCLNVKPSSRVATRTVCINNLHQIDNMKSLWASENGIATNAMPILSNLLPYLGRGSSRPAPTCPADPANSFQTSYSINDLRTPPTCLIVPGKSGDRIGHHLDLQESHL